MLRRFADDGSNRMSSILTPSLPRIAQPWALKDLPPFRPVALKLVRLTANIDVPIAEVQQVLRTDLAFSAEVLRFANSALIGSRAKVNSVAHAVAFLGLERLKALSMTVALREFLSTAKADILMQNCWKYNLATAIICEWLADLLPMEREACYTAGLVHDIGRLALLRGFPFEYECAVEVIPDKKFDLLQAEKEVFDIDHCEAGRWLMDQWGFPSELKDVVTLHHLTPDSKTPLLVTVVYIGWQIADMLGYSPLATRSAATIEEITFTLPVSARERIFSGLDNLPELVSQKIGAAESIHT
jgi:putative nucleotidyltransferase with HDIG domain